MTNERKQRLKDILWGSINIGLGDGLLGRWIEDEFGECTDEDSLYISKLMVRVERALT